ncbi:unnamed protein product [Rhizophagus irregularis]|nr:unnamed protein product [Rhizophagus irregularis]
MIDYYRVLYPDFAEWIPKYYGSLQLQGVQSESNNLETIAQNVREEISSQQANVTEVDDILFIVEIYFFFPKIIIFLTFLFDYTSHLYRESYI